MKAHFFDSSLVQLRASFSGIADFLHTDDRYKSKLTEKQEELILQQYANLEREIKVGAKRMRQSGTVTETANLGEAKKFYLPLITEAYGDGIADQIVHVVPMDSREAFVRFAVIDAATAKNNIAVGDPLWNNGLEGAGVGVGAAARDGLYPYGKVVNEIGETFNVDTSDVLLIALNKPFINPATVVINLVSKDGTETLVTAVGNVDGTLSIVKGVELLASAVMDAEKGNATLTFGTLSAAIEGTVDFSYDYKLERAMLAGKGNKITYSRKAIPLYAEESTIEAYNTFFAQYDVLKEDGVDLNEELLKGGAATIRYARDMRIVETLRDQAALSVANWAITKPADYALAEDYNLTFINRIVDAQLAISERFESAIGNFVLVGTKGMGILRKIGAPRFVGGLKSVKGPYFAGTLDEELKVYYVPKATFANDVVVGYKSEDWNGAGYILGVYLGFVSTAVLMRGDFRGEQGFGEIVAHRMLRPIFYCTFKIV